MEKITSSHRNRLAYVYIRQSTLSQLHNNVESRRVQERLVERAKALGWADPRVIDEDLGYSASGTVQRVGFERLLAAVCAGEVGAIFAFEASRLARNGREWHTLLEMCAVVDTVIIDTEAVYDPKLSNDRLLLGVKGTLSELEIGLFRARSQAAVREKAKRGEYYGIVAVGYRKTRSGQLEKEPDIRVQSSLEFIFQKFREIGSARQLVRWLREEQVKIPRKETISDDGAIVWSLPNERNVATLRQNVHMKGCMEKGGIRGGASVFAGILRCGTCGRRVLVNYSGAHSRSIRYSCATNCRHDDGKRCISFSANNLEKILIGELLETVAPLGVTAALQAAEQLTRKEGAVREQRELELTQAQYESERAYRQYQAVDPLNRLVASELERRWNIALQRVSELQEAVRAFGSIDAISAEEKAGLMELGEDISSVWNAPGISPEAKKRIARTLIKEVVLIEQEGSVKAVVHWQGGEHSEHTVKRLSYRDSASPTAMDTVEIIRQLARQIPDRFITQVLNRLKIPTAKGLTWNEARVRAIRHGHEISVYQEGERESRGEVNMLEAARELGCERSVIRALIESGQLPAQQACSHAPWVIRKEDLMSAKIQEILRQPKRRFPCRENTDQLSLEFQ